MELEQFLKLLAKNKFRTSVSDFALMVNYDLSGFYDDFLERYGEDKVTDYLQRIFAHYNEDGNGIRIDFMGQNGPSYIYVETHEITIIDSETIYVNYAILESYVQTNAYGSGSLEELYDRIFEDVYDDDEEQDDYDSWSAWDWLKGDVTWDATLYLRKITGMPITLDQEST